MKMRLVTGRAWLAVGILPAMLLAMSVLAPAQTVTSQGPPPPLREWEIAAGGTMRFEEASIRKDTSGNFKKPSFALSADDGLPPADGNFHADFPLIIYIQFAYKEWFTGEQVHALLATLPKWALSDTYEIQARAKGKPSKDQMRLMLRSLLADRFGLQVHFETRRLPVFLLTMVKPGKMGPRLHPHTPSCDGTEPADDPAGKTPAAKGPAVKEVFPPLCLDRSLMTVPKPNHVKLTGSRNMTLPVLATYLPSIGDLDRPVIDRTGLQGSVDFSLEFTPEADLPENTGVVPDPNMTITTFHEALDKQLGLILAPAKAPLDVLVVDHVERPAENWQ
jgi:uncharacterized protein (TIGR03435 family)